MNPNRTDEINILRHVTRDESLMDQYVVDMNVSESTAIKMLEGVIHQLKSRQECAECLASGSADYVVRSAVHRMYHVSND